MPTLKWKPAHSVNVMLIDKQHRHFIKLLGELEAHLKANEVDKIKDIIKKLASYADHHFKTEEKYFEQFNYEDREVHKAAHDDLRAEIDKFLNRDDDPKKIGLDLLYFLERWLVLHLRGMDKKYTECFNKNGLC